MPKPSQSGFKRFFYNQNIKRDKSNSKYKSLHNHIVLLLKKSEKDGVTKWLINAVARAQSKITRYGVTFQQVSTILNNKGLGGMITLLEETFSFVDKRTSPQLTATKKEKAMKTPTKKVKTEQPNAAEEVEKKVSVTKTVEKKTTPKKEKTTTKTVEKKATKTPAKKAAPKKKAE